MTEETAVAAVAAPTESAPPSNEPAWYIDDNTPGVGDKPSWMPQNYKKLSDIAKSHSELEKKLGGFTGAPEKYDFSSLEIDENQLIVTEIASVAKELNMSQDGLNKLLGRFQQAVETESNAYLEDQVKKLGPEGEKQLKQFERWTKDYFQPEEAEVIKEMVQTSEQLTMFNKLMANTTMSAVPTNQSMYMANKHETVADIRAELAKDGNLAKFDSDAQYRSNWQARMASAVARENR